MSDYADIIEAGARHFCEGMDDESYLSMRFRFAEKAVSQETENAMITPMALGRIPINNRGETVSVVIGELCAQVERVAHVTFQHDERMSEIVYLWKYFSEQYVIPYLHKKQSACKRAKNNKASASFDNIIKQFSGLVSVVEKTVTMTVKDQNTHAAVEEESDFGYFVLNVSTAKFRFIVEATLADEETATKAMLGDTASCDFTEEDREILKQGAADAKIAAGKREAQRTNGYNQAHFIEEYNAENASETQKQELKAAVQLDKKQYPDPSKQRPHGYWKDLLSHAPSYPSAEALRKAVMRKREDKRGQYKREGKKRGPYIKRV